MGWTEPSNYSTHRRRRDNPPDTTGMRVRRAAPATHLWGLAALLRRVVGQGRTGPSAGMRQPLLDRQGDADALQVRMRLLTERIEGNLASLRADFEALIAERDAEAMQNFKNCRRLLEGRARIEAARTRDKLSHIGPTSVVREAVWTEALGLLDPPEAT